MEESGNGLHYGIVPEFAYRDRKKSRKVSMSGLRTDIRLDLPNKKQDFKPFNSDVW
jgi:hypothetical protein